MARALGRCVGVDVLDAALPEALQREVLLEMQKLARSQGTGQRLTRVLELVTMAPVEIVDSGGVYVDGEAPSAAPHVRIAVNSAGWMDEDDLVGLVRRELRRRSRSSCGLVIGACGPSRSTPASMPPRRSVRCAAHRLIEWRRSWTPTGSAEHATFLSSGPPAHDTVRRSTRKFRLTSAPTQSLGSPSTARAAIGSPSSK